MWIPKRIILQNFLSHRETDYLYKESQLELIQGVNLDSDDSVEESNGSGKSTLLQAEYFALTGNPVRDVKQSDLITDGEKTSSVEFTLFNTKTNVELKILRKLYSNKSSELIVHLNRLLEEFPSILEGDKRIVELLGIQKEDITNYYIISKTKYNSFYSSPDSKKKEIVSRFSGSNLIEGIEKLVEEDVSVLKQKQTALNLEESNIKGRVVVYQEQLENLRDISEEKSELINSVQSRINNEKIKQQNYTHSIEDCRKVIEICKSKIDEEKVKLTVHESNLDNIQKIDNSTLISEINSFEKGVLGKQDEIYLQRTRINREIKQLSETLNSVEINLQGTIECPKCNHQFLFKDKEADVEELKKEVIEVKNLIQQSNTSLISLQKDYDKTLLDLKELSDTKSELKKEMDKTTEIELSYKKEINSCKTAINSYETSILQNENQIKSYLNDISFSEKAIEKYLEEIEDIKKREFEDKSIQLRKTISELTEQLQGFNQRRELIDTEIYEKQEWVYHFIGFKSFLANKAIKSIEGETNYQLSKMRTDVQIKLDGFTLLADGKTIREKISCSVLRNGVEVGSLGKFSEGEKGRVEIATILALQKLLNLSCSSGGLDLLSIDEILESISKRGLENIIESLQNTTSTVKLVTHVSLDKEFSNISRVVVKENGVSKFLN